MKEYIEMYPTNFAPLTKKTLLVSEPFDNETDAEYFAGVITHNYKCKVQVIETALPTSFVVMAHGFNPYLIQSNYRDDINGYIFANMKFE